MAFTHGYNAARYNTRNYNHFGPTFTFLYFFDGLSLSDAYTKAVTLVKAEAVAPSESMDTGSETHPTDTVLLEENFLPFTINKGPQDTIKVAEWVRVERTPPVISWGN